MGWRAEIIVSYNADDKYHHVYATTHGDSKDDALAGAQFVYDSFNKEKERFVRALPVANSEVDFDTKETNHRGFVRFSFSDKNGQTRLVDDSRKIPGIGAIKEVLNG